VFPKALFHGKVSQVISKMHLPGRLVTALSKVKKRKLNSLGNVVSYSAHEIKNLLQPDNSKDKRVEDVERVNESGSSDPA
jgi:hypothetical protein